MNDETKLQIRIKIQEANIALYRNQFSAAYDALKEASFIAGELMIDEVSTGNGAE